MYYFRLASHVNQEDLPDEVEIDITTGALRNIETQEVYDVETVAMEGV